jgi:hypothetical protein
MAFYPIPFGHAEVHIDTRPKRPAQYAESVARRNELKSRGRRSR